MELVGIEGSMIPRNVGVLGKAYRMSCQTHSGQQLQAQTGYLLLADDFQYKPHMALETTNVRNLEPALGNASKSIHMLQNRSPADILGAIPAEG